MATTKSKPHNFSLTGFIQLTRFWNLLIIVFAQYFTASFLIDGTQEIAYFLLHKRLFLLSFSSVLIAAAGYIINDYYDVKIDLINKPHRVVVGKVLKRRVAMAAHTALNFIGIAIGFLLSWQIGLIHFFSALLLWLYSNQLKRMPFIGNFAVAVLTGLSIFIVDVLFQSGNKIVVAYALFAFIFTLIREVIKDMEDLKGDASFGCRTLPVVYGLRQTKNFIYALSIIFLGSFCYLGSILAGSDMTYFCLILIIPLGILAQQLYKADTVKQFGFLSNYCKLIMIFGILSMIIFKQ